MKKQYLSKTKKGVTSLYVVVFATILFGVITLGFIRLIVSESSQSRDTELSQSAYDAAMAGVEDAKVAASQYYKCKKDTNGAFTGECARYKDLFDGDCTDYKLAKALYGLNDATAGEIKIQESDDGASETSTEQAYTCAIVSNTVADYRGTLDSASRVKVIPLITDGNAPQLHTIAFSWYSEKNGTSFSGLNHGGYLMNRANSTIPPAISLTLVTLPAQVDASGIKVDSTSYLTDYYTLSSTLHLPTEGVSINPPSTISRNVLRESVDSSIQNNPFGVGCAVKGFGDEFACQVRLQTENHCLTYNPPYNNNDTCNMYLVASMPYGTVATDFKVEMWADAFGQHPIQFRDVQISVDSTGRANDLYRRVETRLSPSDDYFPYIQFELDLGDKNGGAGDESFNKNFWVTDNCWLTGRAEGENGKCANNSR